MKDGRWRAVGGGRRARRACIAQRKSHRAARRGVRARGDFALCVQRCRRPEAGPIGLELVGLGVGRLGRVDDQVADVQLCVTPNAKVSPAARAEHPAGM